MRRIGIDVGGTNTDAVLIEEGKVAGAVKAPTSEDVTTGILDALKALGATGVLKGKKIDGVMIGTTHFINAVVQRRSLTRVAALRLGMPASASLPPFCDWPADPAGPWGGAAASPGSRRGGSPSGPRPRCRRAATGPRAWRRWCAAASGWSRAATN